VLSVAPLCFSLQPEGAPPAAAEARAAAADAAKRQAAAAEAGKANGRIGASPEPKPKP